MVTCFAYGAISEAACARQRLHTISCGYAMCLLQFPVISHLRVQSLALATFFCHSFATCVAMAFACNASLPFRCHQCCQGLLLAAQFLPLNFEPMLLPPPRICPCFLPPMLPLPLPPSFFPIHVALQIATAIATAIAFALEVAMVVAIKFGRLIEHCSWILDKLNPMFHYCCCSNRIAPTTQ